MSKTVNAKFANGVFTPLEPVAFPEGAIVVLKIDAGATEQPQITSPAEPFVPHDGKFLPGMEDPQKIKQLLADQDLEHYSRSLQQGGSV